MLGLGFCLFTVRVLLFRALSLALPSGGLTWDLTISSKDLILDCICSVPEFTQESVETTQGS